VSAVNPSRARGLGAELRKARKQAGLSLDYVGREIGRSESYVSRCETGKSLASVENTIKMLTLYGVKGAEYERLVQLAREAADPNWVMPGMDEQLAALIEDEKIATSITNVHPLMIPGLCQTEEYARALLVGADTPRGQADQRILVRLNLRQPLLTASNPPLYVAIIGEQALRQPPCDNAVMAGQLRKLLDLGKLPNVSILVLPFTRDYTPAIEGSFVLMELRRGGPVVQLENFSTTTMVTHAQDVANYQAAAEKVRRKAMDEADSAAFIEELLREMERRE
jgi:transcriptional regulator with XRE-family HTH domain